jgi:hypothetical protein
MREEQNLVTTGQPEEMAVFDPGGIQVDARFPSDPGWLNGGLEFLLGGEARGQATRDLQRKYYIFHSWLGARVLVL